MKLEPLYDRVVIQAVKPVEVSQGGIFIPESAQEKSQEAIVIAVGPGIYENGTLVPTVVKAGDKILYGKYAGAEITLDKEPFIIIKETDILGIIKESN